MTIKKFQGKTKEEAIDKAKAELGSQVVIMNVKEVRPGGFFGFFKRSSYEVTAAIEDDVLARPSYRQVSKTMGEGNNFSAVADESIAIKPVSYNESMAASPKETVEDSAKKRTVPTNDAMISKEPLLEKKELQDAFSAVNEVIQQDKIQASDVLNYNKNAAVIKKEDVLSQNISMPGERMVHPAAGYKEDSDPVSRLYKNTESLNEKFGTNNRGFVKMLYKILLDNEVDEKYVNQILEDMEKVIQSGNNLDYLLSNVYQKMVLKFGKPQTIDLDGKKPHIIFLIGPTGVGKTTTIAKLASKYKLDHGKTVAFLTTDTYRMAATEQLQTYAKILQIPLAIVYSAEELNGAVAKNENADLIFVDTAGFSHKNPEQKEEMAKILSSLDAAYSREIYLVLSATTKYPDLKKIIDTYREFTDFQLIFTKLDETDLYGNILNSHLYSGANLSYITDGQGVPKDIQVLDTQRMVTKLLGGQ